MVVVADKVVSKDPSDDNNYNTSLEASPTNNYVVLCLRDDVGCMAINSLK